MKEENNSLVQFDSQAVFSIFPPYLVFVPDEYLKQQLSTKPLASTIT